MNAQMSLMPVVAHAMVEPFAGGQPESFQAVLARLHNEAAATVQTLQAMQLCSNEVPYRSRALRARKWRP